MQSIDIHSLQQLLLAQLLHPLGNNLAPHPVRYIDNHPHKLLVGLILLQSGDERGVELDVVRFQFAKQGE